MTQIRSNVKKEMSHLILSFLARLYLISKDRPLIKIYLFEDEFEWWQGLQHLWKATYLIDSQFNSWDCCYCLFCPCNLDWNQGHQMVLEDQLDLPATQGTPRRVRKDHCAHRQDLWAIQDCEWGPVPRKRGENGCSEGVSRLSKLMYHRIFDHRCYHLWIGALKHIWLRVSLCVPLTAQNLFTFDYIVCFFPPLPPNLAEWIPPFVSNWIASIFAPDQIVILLINWYGGHSTQNGTPPVPPTGWVVRNWPLSKSTKRNWSWSTSSPALPWTPIKARLSDPNAKD